MSQIITNVIAGLYEPYDFDTITVSSSAVGLTASKYNHVPPNVLRDAQYIVITSETNSIRYRIDGTDPTASVGHLMPAGSALVLTGITTIRNFKAIATGSDATLQVTYSR